MLVYNTKKGILIERDGAFFLIPSGWDEFINRDDLYDHLLAITSRTGTVGDGREILENYLLPPVGNQEIWGAGVTYMRSREARKEEARDAGGGDFYHRVYEAERPEVFFKANPFRVAGSGGPVRIRRDSVWNVPEPELTLMVSSGAKIIGYTAGNDMSSRDIEGENPLYLPQAKTYDGSAAVGPGIYVPGKPLSPDTVILLQVLRRGSPVFEGEVSISQMKRKHTELVEFLFRECSFPSGCLLMTGTGIIPPNDFTLQVGDEIRISIGPIGTLVNHVS
jgi:2-dehydro-3-deoxy-D-arabinonate dehydratase